MEVKLLKGNIQKWNLKIRNPKGFSCERMYKTNLKNVVEV